MSSFDDKEDDSVDDGPSDEDGAGTNLPSSGLSPSRTVMSVTVRERRASSHYTGGICSISDNTCCTVSLLSEEELS